MSLHKHLFILSVLSLLSIPLSSQSAESKIILNPVLTPDAKTIIFRKDYQIFVYDVDKGKTSKPEILLFLKQ